MSKPFTIRVDGIAGTTSIGIEPWAVCPSNVALHPTLIDPLVFVIDAVYSVAESPCTISLASGEPKPKIMRFIADSFGVGVSVALIVIAPSILVVLQAIVNGSGV
jgi:hypothetical protein